MSPGDSLSLDPALVGALQALQSPAATDEALAAAADALCMLFDQAAQLGPDGERLIGQALARQVAPEQPGDTLLATLRLRFLIAHAPVQELAEAIQAAQALQDWPLALKGLERLHDTLGERTPRSAFGLAAHCLHLLGRYADAERWTREGLGADAARIAPLTPFSQDELLARWGGRSDPVVSIICTTYNHERYIEDALCGFLGQDLDQPFEILVHDDASTDRTAAIVQSWQRRYPLIIKPLLQRENQFSRGVRPFELMLARARGAFIATCEGDDFWIDAGKLSRQCALLRQDPALVCVMHNYLHLVESTLTLAPWRPTRHDIRVSPRDLKRVRLLIWLPTLMFRRCFEQMPPERALSTAGDNFLTSWLGTFGAGLFVDTFVGAVRRENNFSSWTPLPEAEKEKRRVRNFAALVRLHERLGDAQAVQDLMQRINESPLSAPDKLALLQATRLPLPAPAEASPA
ncbi:MAG: glycosyltransferase [Burkholderiales bacterium]|nr:glycosyltransferase [Burkholderiales bacterium]